MSKSDQYSRLRLDTIASHNEKHTCSGFSAPKPGEQRRLGVTYGPLNTQHQDDGPSRFGQ